MRRLLPTLGLLGLLLPTLAAAQDYEAEAHRRMKLSFDMDAVEEMLEASAPAAARLQHIVRAPLPLEPNSELDRVTVFRDRALVTRHQALTLAAGDHAVAFEGLPLSILDGSITATAEGGLLLGVEVVSGTGELDEARKIAIKAQLRTHVDALGDIRDRMESLLAQRSALRRAALAQSQDGAPPVREIDALLDYVGNAERELAKELRAQEDLAKDLDELIAPLLVKLANPLATGKTVRVDVRSPRKGPVTVELRYAVAGAGWTPAYDVRYDPVAEELDLAYVGVVQQGTGELWDGARLSLSTAVPEVGGSLPDLATWRLGSGGVGTALATGQGVSGGQSGVALAGGSDLISQDLSASVEQAGAVVFDLPGERTVVGDGSAQRLPLGIQRYRVTPSLEAVPRSVSRVYRQGTFRTDGSVPLLPGPVAIYVGGAYVGAGQVGSVVPGEPLQLALGTDDAVRVQRRVVERHRDLSGRKHRYTFRFALTVTNPTDRPRTVNLRDQLPISEDADVSVRALEGTPEALGPDGSLSWVVQVPPGASREVQFGFTVVAPADRHIPELDALL